LGVRDRNVLDDRNKLKLLFAVRRRGPCTQRDVAAALAIPKVEARRLLRAAVGEGLIEEAVDDSPSVPGRRVFTISEAGIPELERLRKTVWRAG
jgi:predicted ArsR family transcriptional regulator